MYQAIKTQISLGNFKLIDMKKRIERFYLIGAISADQMDELLSMAAEKANPDTERPELMQLILSLFAKVEALTARVKVLEDGNAADDSGNGSVDYPAWEPWDGLSDRYQSGAIVSHIDRLWESTFPGQNVWEPGTVGDQFWIPYTPDE